MMVMGVEITDNDGVVKMEKVTQTQLIARGAA